MKLPLRGLREYADVLNDLNNLFMSQLIGKGRHIGPPIVHHSVDCGIARSAHIRGAKVCSMQLFAKGRVPTSVGPMAKRALLFEDDRASRSFVLFLPRERGSS
jgi:hypothetical protein